MEHRAGIEPANTGFADQRVSPFATGARLKSSLHRAGHGGVRAKRPTYFGCAVSEVRLHCLVARENLVRFLVGYRPADNHVVPLFPVRRRRYLVLPRQLDRVEHAQNLIKIPARRHGIRQRQLDPLIRSDHEYRPHRCILCRRPPVRRLPRIPRQHVVQLRDLQLLYPR